MGRSQREEARLLSKDEQELVANTRHPAIQQVPNGELSELLHRIRERRDRAGDIAKRQRRELRGKGSDTGQGGADNSGTIGKRDLLTSALKRTRKELERRRSADAKSRTMDSARRALAMKTAAENLRATDNPASEDRTAHEGMQPLPNEGIAASGAFHAEGYRPVVDRTRRAR